MAHKHRIHHSHSVRVSSGMYMAAIRKLSCGEQYLYSTPEKQETMFVPQDAMGLTFKWEKHETNWSLVIVPVSNEMKAMFERGLHDGGSSEREFRSMIESLMVDAVSNIDKSAVATEDDNRAGMVGEFDTLMASVSVQPFDKTMWSKMAAEALCLHGNELLRATHLARMSASLSNTKEEAARFFAEVLLQNSITQN